MTEQCFRVTIFAASLLSDKRQENGDSKAFFDSLLEGWSQFNEAFVLWLNGGMTWQPGTLDAWGFSRQCNHAGI